MAPAYSNAFDLLGDDETDDVGVLYDRMKHKVVDEVPSSPTNTNSSKGVTFFAESEQVENVSNVAENRTASEDGWQQIVRRKRRGQVTDDVNANCSEQAIEEGRLNGDNGQYQGNGSECFEQSNGASASETNPSEVNCEEAVEKNVSDNSDIPERVETPEEEKLRKENEERRRKQREKADQLRKETEERRKKRREERAEEARKRTLAQYEQIILEKQQKLPKAEAKRVVALDKELENMKLVSKKPDHNLVVSESQLKKGSKQKKSETQVKKSSNSVAADLAKVFRLPSFHESVSNNDGQQSSNGRPTVTSVPLPPAAEVPTSETDPPNSESEDASSVIYDRLFPVLGLVSPNMELEPCEPSNE